MSFNARAAAAALLTLVALAAAPAIASADSWDPMVPAPYALKTTVYSFPTSSNKRGNAEFRALVAASDWWDAVQAPENGSEEDNQSAGVRSSAKVDADTWSVEVSTYDVQLRLQCTNEWTIDFPGGPAIVTGPASTSCGSYEDPETTYCPYRYFDGPALSGPGAPAQIQVNCVNDELGSGDSLPIGNFEWAGSYETYNDFATRATNAGYDHAFWGSSTVGTGTYGAGGGSFMLSPDKAFVRFYMYMPPFTIASGSTTQGFICEYSGTVQGFADPYTPDPHTYAWTSNGSPTCGFYTPA